MATEIFFTENDVGGGGKGRDALELSFSKLLGRLGHGFVVSGMAPATSADLTFTLPTGEAIIAGYFIKTDAALTVGCTASVLNYIWLKLTKDGNGKVTGVALEARTANTVPNASSPRDYVKICEATCSGSAITAVSDRRPLSPNVASGSYVGDSATDRLICLGFAPRFVVLVSDSRWFFSNLNEPDATTGRTGLEIIVPALQTANTARPRLSTDGFLVSGSTAGNTNFVTTPYSYLALS